MCGSCTCALSSKWLHRCSMYPWHLYMHSTPWNPPIEERDCPQSSSQWECSEGKDVCVTFTHASFTLHFLAEEGDILFLNRRVAKYMMHVWCCACICTSGSQDSPPPHWEGRKMEDTCTNIEPSSCTLEPSRWGERQSSWWLGWHAGLWSPWGGCGQASLVRLLQCVTPLQLVTWCRLLPLHSSTIPLHSCLIHLSKQMYA